MAEIDLDQLVAQFVRPFELLHRDLIEVSLGWAAILVGTHCVSHDLPLCWGFVV